MLSLLLKPRLQMTLFLSWNGSESIGLHEILWFSYSTATYSLLSYSNAPPSIASITHSDTDRHRNNFVASVLDFSQLLHYVRTHASNGAARMPPRTRLNRYQVTISSTAAVQHDSRTAEKWCVSPTLLQPTNTIPPNISGQAP